MDTGHYSSLVLCADGSKLSSGHTLENVCQLAHFLHCAMNIVSLASSSIDITQPDGHRYRVLPIGNLTPFPLHFRRNRSRHVYLFICCVSVLPLSGLVRSECKRGDTGKPLPSLRYARRGQDLAYAPRPLSHHKQQ